ncbi:MAG: hybrid sensor histidine kinase/response regulator [Armatimonadota bacterium]
MTTKDDHTEHKLQEEITESDSRFRRLLDDVSTIAVQGYGPDGTTRYWNKASERLYGYTAQEAIGNSLLELIIPPDMRPAVQHALTIMAETGEPIPPAELQLMRKDGSYVDVYSSHALVKVAGRETEMYCLDIDMTERKRAEAALNRSESLLNQAQKVAKMGSWTWYPKTNRLEWSEGMYHVHGLSIESLTGDLADAMNRSIHPDDRHIVARANEAVIATGIAAPAVFRVIWPDASVHVIRAEGGECEVDENGAVVSLSGYAQDITEQRRVEEAIHESERKYREIFNATTDAILIRDAATWAIVDVNQPMLELFGYASKAEVYALESGSLSAGTPNYTQADVTPYIQRALSGKIPSFEWLSRKKSGELFWSDITMRSSQIGGHDRVLVTIRDISERKRVEEALRESEASHRVLVSSLPDIIMRFDNNYRHLYISSNITTVIQQPVSAFIGKTPREMGLPDEQCSFWERAIDRVFSYASPFETEFVFESNNGTHVYDCRLVPEYDAQGKVRSVLSLNRDITAQRRAEDDYKTLFRQMQTGFALHEIICDESGKPVDYRFIAANPAYERLTGMAASHIIGRTVLDVLPTVERYWIEAFGKVALTGEPVTFENYSSALDKYFEVTAFQPAAGQFASLITDVSARKKSDEEKAKLEETLGHALKMESVGRLAGGVAHDFNNMLGVILGHTQMAIEQLYPDHPLYDDLTEIRSAANRSADLTRQLLAFARKQTIQPKVQDLNVTIANMSKMLERLIGESITLRLLPYAHIWSVKVDPSQIDQMLANLCVNARDAITDVGTIIIKTGIITIDESNSSLHSGSSTGDYVWLSVTDTGQGMDKPTIERIFEPFFTTKGVGEGTGLGLSTVYGAVKQNGGFIEVASELGQGTTFTIYLPRHAGDDMVSESDDRHENTTGSNETILLVEDEPTILRMTRTMLERLGYAVIAAQSPLQAIDAAEAFTGKIDLLLTDVVMPEMNGRDLARRIQSRYPHIKRMFMSGYTSDVIAHHGKLEDGVSFIQKPFTMSGLSEMIRQALHRSSV